MRKGLGRVSLFPFRVFLHVRATPRVQLHFPVVLILYALHVNYLRIKPLRVSLEKSETATGLYLLFHCKHGSYLPESEALIALIQVCLLISLKQPL